MGCFSLPSLQSFKSARRRSSAHGPTATRVIHVGHKPPPSELPISPDKYPDNCVITSKYTIWNFLPKNLFGQFRRIANFYFLCVAVIQLSINSPVSPATSLSPLIFVVVVTAIKQAYEDWLRHKADSAVNKQLVRVVKNDELQRIRSQNIRVGDIVMVKSDEEFPCDLVLLSSSDPEGFCHITTANLDGETNLKRHECLSETKVLDSPEKLQGLQASIECQLPDADLYRFIGRMNVFLPSESSIIRHLGPVNLLLKGARLKNTPFIYGCAVYTGSETKMVLNLKLTSSKFSTVERSMNKFLIIFLILLLIEVTIATILKYTLQTGVLPWYLPPPETIKARVVFADFLAFVVLFNYIIPISLYVSLELVKFVGAMFFGWDEKLYDPESGEFAMCNTSDLNEELGQVEYLFTDKTGTLTENFMQFRQCSINGQRYTEFGGMLCLMPAGLHTQPEIVHQFTPDIENFLLVLAICNTVQIVKKDSSNGVTDNCHSVPNEIEYQASSPDEKALVEACRMFGVVLSNISDNHYEIHLKEKVRILKRLHVLEFDSVRRCMSVVVQDEKGDYYLYCKGAESSVLEFCLDGPKNDTLNHVDGYAVGGLRTLVVASKHITSAQYLKFSEDMQNARNCMLDRENKVFNVFRYMERGLTVLGATAVEDKLQDGVSLTLEMLRAAGIRIWVLTGDKHETAVNISYSCHHIKRGMSQLNLTLQSCAQECLATLQQIFRRILAEPLSSYALIVDGSSLTYAIGEHKELFSETARRCDAVLCCRMSPLQKAQVVTMIKRLPSNPITAAIGDGANDVSMIQEAHIGLGIIGKEGRQAVRCSDFAFSKFKFLQRVFLVHGHYYYVRVAVLVQYFFYKNIAFITPQVIYAIFNEFSTQPLYHSIYLMFYNIFFTSLPILLYGFLEQNIPQETLMKSPNLYKSISCNAKLTAGQFLRWMIEGFWHAIVCYFGVYLLFNEDIPLLKNGQVFDMWTFSTAIYHTVCYIVNVKLLIHTRYFTYYSAGAFLVTLLGFEAFSLLYNAIMWPFQDNELYGVYYKLCSSPAMWFSLLLFITMALLPDLLGLLMQNNFNKLGRFIRSMAASCLKPAQPPATLYYNPQQTSVRIFTIFRPQVTQTSQPSL